MRVAVIALCGLVLAAFALAFSANATTRPKPSHATTYMYVGNQRRSTGSLIWGESQPRNGGLAWIVDGNCGYENGWAEMNAARTYVNVHEMDGMRASYGRRLSATRWAIYALWPRRLAGIAVQRRANRWEVLKKGRPYGQTEGPWGPPAAAALLGYCA